MQWKEAQLLAYRRVSDTIRTLVPRDLVVAREVRWLYLYQWLWLWLLAVAVAVAVTVTVAVAVAVDVDVAAILHITTRRVRDRRACR